jgi:hypothetical protein
MKEEMDSIQENQTWLSRDQAQMGVHAEEGWIWCTDQEQSPPRRQGKCEQAIIDFDEVFAPVAQMESIRLVLALATDEGWEVHHMDVKAAFLKGELTEEVYVQPPQGFVIAREEHKVLRLPSTLRTTVGTTGINEKPQVGGKLHAKTRSGGERRT